MFQSRDVDHARNIVQVNGIDVFGGLPASPARDAWNGNILLIEPHHQLRETGNVFHVESRNSRGEGADDIDDFIIDNVVIVFKTADVSLPLPSAAGDLAAFVKTEFLPSITNVNGSGHGGHGRSAQRIRAPHGIPAGRVARRLSKPPRRLLGPRAHSRPG